MKKMLALLGVLAVFSLTLTPVYAAESSTWGRIKATFSENQDMTSDEFQLLPGEAFQDRAAKPVRGSKRVRDTGQTTKFIKAKRGGTLSLDTGRIKMKLAIQPGALAGNAAVAIYVRKGADGLPWFGVQALPHRTCTPPAKLTIEATIPLADLPDNFALVHGINTGVRRITYGSKDRTRKGASSWEAAACRIKVEEDKKAGTATVKITAYLPEFSRYAMASSR